MSQLAFPSSPHVEIVLIVLQLFQVLFLWLLDWIPLGRLNDVTAVSSQDTSLHLVVVTLIQSVPFTIGWANFAGHGSGLGRWRWVVERTFAWMNQLVSQHRGQRGGSQATGNLS
jgi:hypothetical protein